MSKVNMNEVMDTATEVGRNWNGKQVAMFHYFNPNGLYSKKRASDEKIAALVKDGKLPSSALFLHGSLGDYNMMKLAHFATGSRVNRRNLQMTLQALQNDIEKANSAITEVAA